MGTATADATPEGVPSDRTIRAWLGAKEAAAFLEVSPKTLAKLVERRMVTCRSIPGAKPKYLVASLDRLIERSTSVAVEEVPTDE